MPSRRTTSPGTPTRSAFTLGLLCLAQLMIALDITVVSVANPAIERALAFSPEQLQWTVTGYALTFGGFLLIGGRLGDIVGRRRLFLSAVLGFTVASLGAGFASTETMLIAFRAGQGLFAAAISPATLSLVATTFPEAGERRRAYGIWSTAGSLGGVLGFVLGGVMTAAQGWRSIFFINAPIGLAVVIAGAALLPRDARVNPVVRPDLIGSVSVTLGVSLIIYGLGTGQSDGWTAPKTTAVFVASLVLLGLFVRTERRSRHPIVPAELLRRRESIGMLIAAFQAVVVTTTVYFESIYMQQVFGYSSLQTGLASLPLPAGVALGANVTARILLRRFTARQVASGGLVTLAAALAYLARIPEHGSYAIDLAPPLLLLGLGLGAASVCLITIVTTDVDSENQGVIAGIYNMSQQLGGAVGLAGLVTVASTVAGGTSASVGNEANGIRVAFLISAIIAAAGAVLAASQLPGRRLQRRAVPQA